MRLAVRPARLIRAIFITCLLIEIGFVVLDYQVNYGRLTDIGAIRRLTNIAREDGLASWFGTTQTLLVALTLWAIVLVVRQQQGLRWRQTGWMVAAFLFTYMAVDDGAQVHERLGTTLRVLQPDAAFVALDTFPSYAWQVLFVPIFGTLGVTLAAFLWRELGEGCSRALVLAALCGFALAVGLDFVEGLDADHPWNIYSAIDARNDLASWTTSRFSASPYDTLEHFSRSLEEFVEMLSTTVFWVVFLRYLTRITPEVRVRWVR